MKIKRPCLYSYLGNCSSCYCTQFPLHSENCDLASCDSYCCSPAHCWSLVPFYCPVGSQLPCDVDFWPTVYCSPRPVPKAGKLETPSPGKQQYVMSVGLGIGSISMSHCIFLCKFFIYHIVAVHLQS